MSYNKQNFKVDQILTATHLNNMENGIVNNETAIENKQDILVSGTNIKTVNGISLLGSGNIAIDGGGTGSSSAASSVPAYWQTYLTTKAKEVNALNEANGSKGDTFIFITDTHIPNNYGNSIAAINELCKLTSVNKVFFGGDMIASAGSATDMAEQARKLVRSFDPHLEIHPMRGYHDTDHNAGENQYWDAFIRNVGRYSEADGNMYYYRDDKTVKVRYIIMDSIYTEGRLGVNIPDEKQINWVRDRILELEGGWSVLIVTHSIWIGSGAIGEAGRVILDMIDEIYDTASCTIIGVMCGHCHADKNATFDKGYIAFSSLYDYKGGTAGTTNEQVFDVVNIDLQNGIIKTIRIGRGSNRQFNYSVKMDLPVEGVSLGRDNLPILQNSTKTITAQITPSATSRKAVNWEIVSGSEYISINANELNCDVTGIAVGDAVIKVTTVDGGFEATCTISVKEASDMPYMDISSNFTFEAGSVAYATGANNTDTNYVRSDYTDISDFVKLEIAMPQTTNSSTSHGIAFYDSNKTFISGVQILTGGSWSYGIKEVAVPSNAVYVRAVYYGDKHPNRPAGLPEFSCIGHIFE